MKTSKFLIDTNIYMRDYKFASQASRIMIEGCERAGCRLLIPNTVMLEVTKHYYRDIEAAYATYAIASAKLSRLCRAEIDPGAGRNAADTALSSFQNSFLLSLSRCQPIIVDTPRFDPEEVVRRAVMRTRPFGDNGAGFQDTMIWLTILELMQADTDHYALVTDNHKDFCKGADPHPDLIGDLESAGVDPARLAIYPDIAAFNASVITPNLELVNNVCDLVQPAIETWAPSGVADILRHNEYDRLIVGLTGPAGTARLAGDISVRQVAIADARRLGNRVIAHATIVFDANISIGWSHETYSTDIDVRDLVDVLSDPPFPGESASCDVTPYCTIELDVVVESDSAVSAITIRSLTSDFGHTFGLDDRFSVRIPLQRTSARPD